MLHKTPKLKFYLIGILIAAVIIIPFASFQLFIIYGKINLHLVAIPASVMIIFGFLLGSILRMRRELKIQGDLFKAIADFALEFSYVQNNKGEFIYVSPAAKDLTGCPVEDFYRKPNLMETLIHADDLPAWKKTADEILKNQISSVIDLRIATPDRGICWMRHHAGPVIDEKGNTTGIRATNIDITLQKLNEDKIRNLADYDVLTGLPNRRCIHRHLTELIREGDAHEKEFAVIFMDLDRFKFVNDAHGHSMGDILLGQVSKRLKDVCKNDCALIGRFGGDEFVILLSPGISREQIQQKCRELTHAANEPFHHEGMRFSLGASLGVTLYPHDGEDAESLIKNADAAMYHAKRNSDENIHFFSAEIGQAVSETFHYEIHLREAIQENRIDVHFQPIIDIKTGRISAVEALARWMKADGSYVPPSNFIPLAEDMGKIHILDTKIAEKACRQLRIWQKEGMNLKMSLNISPRRFQHNDFCRDMFRIISENDLNPSSLKLEITESALIENIESSREKIRIMREALFDIAIDDFGTGFSSLAYLTTLPINILKIDRSFVSAMTHGKRYRAVVEGILNLAKSLEISVIAEGIETEEQLLLLKSSGCREGQGYFYAKPMNSVNFEIFYREREEQFQKNGETSDFTI